MNKLIRIYLILLVLIVLTLHVIHTFSICNLTVDNTSIFLLIILILIPFITTIKKFKWGDFEAEIETKDVEKVKESVDKATSNENKNNSLTPKTINGYTEKEVSELIDYLINLSDIDPVLAIAKLRVELEKLIRGVYLAHSGDEKRMRSIGYMTNYLINKEDFKSDELESANMIINISNRVIHGEKIDKVGAKTIVLSAVKLLGFMTGYTKALENEGMLRKE